MYKERRKECIRMSKAWKRYFDEMQGVVQSIIDTQGENIEKAAELFAESTIKGGIIRAFGSGHSALITEDVHWRSATLANVQAIVEQSVSGPAEVTKSSYVEKLTGYGEIIVKYNKIAPPDVLVAISTSGNNAVTIDVARACRSRGVPVIAITAVNYSNQLKTLHPDAIKLKDCADVVLDNCAIFGDAAVDIEDFDIKVGSTSTIPGVYLLNAALAQAVENLVRQGFEPDVYYNGNLGANLDKVNEHNNRLIDKYYYKIRNL